MWAMRFFKASVCALGIWAAMVLPASAGWDNVFQPTLFERWRQPTVAQYYVPPVVVSSSPVVVAQSSPVVVAQSSPCDTCQQPVQRCTTNYVQRSYYQPVTTYETRTVQEQVTTYRTSYYYEPVVSYRYSSYYDSCSCSYTQVATPCTSYQLKAQSCPVQSWVSRCVQVPVQGYQKVDYWQPQTTCCNTTVGAPVYTQPQPAANPPVVNPPVVNPPPSSQEPPSIRGTITPGASSNNKMWEQYYPPIEKPEIRTNPGTTSWQPQLGAPETIKTNEPQPKPANVKLDRIAVGSNSVVEGQVARLDNSPKANAKVLFVNALTSQKQTTYTNASGRFQTELPAGSWHVYLHGADDLPVYHSRVDVNGAQFRQVNLVSRSN
jgi:hypothetical protein